MYARTHTRMNEGHFYIMFVILSLLEFYLYVFLLCLMDTSFIPKTENVNRYTV